MLSAGNVQMEENTAEEGVRAEHLDNVAEKPRCPDLLFCTQLHIRNASMYACSECDRSRLHIGLQTR